MSDPGKAPERRPGEGEPRTPVERFGYPGKTPGSAEGEDLEAPRPSPVEPGKTPGTAEAGIEEPPRK